jgi:sn-glycerol 3-phosphate transport system substrate-binding protein
MALDVHAQTGACAYAYDLSASTFEGWLRSRGANLLSDDATVAVFNGREGVDALEMMVRLIDVGAACRSEGPDGVMEEFAKGNVAFVMGSTAEGGAYRQAVARAGIIDGWGQTIIPQSNPDHPRTVLHGGNIFVLKGDDLGQKAAWLLVRFLADTEQTARGDVASGAVPVRRSASALLEDQLANDPIAREQLERIVPYAYPEANARGTQEMRVHIREAMVAALEGSMTPQEALDQAALRSDQALALGRQ